MRRWKSAAPLALALALVLAWTVAGPGGTGEARACEKAAAAAATAVPAAATLLGPNAVGMELLGVPSQREAPSVATPTTPPAPMPLAPIAPLAPAAPLAPVPLTPMRLAWDEIVVRIDELADSQAALESANEALEHAADWLASGSTAPTPPTKATTRTRAPRHEHSSTRRGWTYGSDADDDDGQVRVDTTVAVRKGMTLALENFGGSIDLKTWGKNAVRVRALHGRRSWVAMSSEGGRLDVSSQARFGPPGAVDYEITMPQWMYAKLSGVYNDVTAEGLEGGLTVETVSGDIRARRVAGDIVLRSVQGNVIVDGAKGNLQVSSVNDGVRITNSDGVIAAEAVNGDIQLVDLRSKMVEATTVGGEVVYAGTILDDGDYRFSTHNGDIALALTDASNATVSVATFSGEFESPFRVPIKKLNKDKRFRFVLGSGAAKVNLESFDGAIQLFRPGEKMFKTFTMSEWFDREKERQKNKQAKAARQAAREDQENQEDVEDDE